MQYMSKESLVQDGLQRMKHYTDAIINAMQSVKQNYFTVWYQSDIYFDRCYFSIYK